MKKKLLLCLISYWVTLGAFSQNSQEIIYNRLYPSDKTSCMVKEVEIPVSVSTGIQVPLVLVYITKQITSKSNF